MVEAADGPEDPDDTGCGRVIERPAVASALPVGGTNTARPLGLRVPKPPRSDDMPFGWPVGVVMVEVDEAELSEALELDRWLVLRGCGGCDGFCMFRARVSSSCERPFKLLLLHPVREGG